jgi:hypothetical protein
MIVAKEKKRRKEVVEGRVTVVCGEGEGGTEFMRVWRVWRVWKLVSGLVDRKNKR